MHNGQKVVDVHGHMTTPPQFRGHLAGMVAQNTAGWGKLDISDEMLEAAQARHLKVMDERNIDFQLLGPRPIAMWHWLRPFLQEDWCTKTNDVIARICKLHPDRFVGMAQLPQNRDRDTKSCIPEFERCIKELGFVGGYVNPDPGADKQTPGMADEYWYPIYEKSQELDAPLMVHPSMSHDPRIEHIPANYQMNNYTEEFLVIIVFVFLFGRAITLYTDLLWFEEIGFFQIFAKSLAVKGLLGSVFGGLFFLLAYFNLRLASQMPSETRIRETQGALDLPSPHAIDPLIKRLLLPVTLLLGILAAPQAAMHWKSALLFFNGVPFGIQDPLFGQDIGFYLFRLPALKSLYNWFLVVLGVVTLANAYLYFLYRGIHYSPQGLSLIPRARKHLFALIASLLLVLAGGYLLDAFELLYSPPGGSLRGELYGHLCQSTRAPYLGTSRLGRLGPQPVPDFPSGGQVYLQRTGCPACGAHHRPLFLPFHPSILSSDTQ